MTLDDWRYITTIAEVKSFTKAAKLLYIAQPSLSQRVRYIESQYDITIFLRNSRGVWLTEDGELFVEYAKRILEAEQELRDKISARKHPDDKLISLGVPQIINTWVFDELMMGIHDTEENVRFRLVEQASPELQEMLLTDELDLAVCYLPLKSQRLDYEVIYKDRFVLMPAKGGELDRKLKDLGYEYHSVVDAELLVGEPFALGMTGTKSNMLANTLAKKHRISFNVLHYCKNFTTLHNMAENGIASVFVNESLFDKYEAPGPYYYLKDSKECELDMGIIWKREKQLSRVEKLLIEIAKETLLESEQPEME